MPALTSDPVAILIASDAWGTRQILDACRPLSHEQFHRKFEIGLGSLHLTLTHMVSTMRRWTDRLAERPVRPMLHTVADHPHVGGENQDRTVDELARLLHEAEQDLLAVARSIQAQGRLGTTVSLDWPGGDGTTKTYTFTRGAVLVHVTTHGYHHRAQCLNMLRQLGATVPGVTAGTSEPSAVDWQWNTEAPPVIRRAS